MWDKLKGFLAWVGAAALAVAGYLLGRHISGREDVSGTGERAGRIREDIRGAAGDNSSASDDAEAAARDNRRAAEHADTAADYNQQARNILRRIRERGSPPKDTDNDF